MEQNNTNKKVKAKEVSLEELKETFISKGNIYLPRLGNIKDLTLQLKPLDIITEEFYSLAKKRNAETALLEDHLNPDDLNHIKTKLRKLGETQDPTDFRKLASEIAKDIKKDIFLYKTKANLGELSIIMFKVFSDSNFKIYEELFSNSYLFYQRAILTSSLAVTFAYLLGYQDILFLKDLYHVSWMMDLAFSKIILSPNMKVASELERIKSGAGLIYLKKVKSRESKIFLTHPKLSFEQAKQEWGHCFQDSLILDAIKFQHEDKLGNGFYHRVQSVNFSLWESALFAADHMITYDERKIDQVKYLKIPEVWKELDRFHKKDLGIQRMVKTIEEQTKMNKPLGRGALYG